MTNRQYIIKFLTESPSGLTSTAVTNLIKKEKGGTIYLIASISSKLQKMKLQGLVEVDSNNKGPRGGMIYKLKNI